MAEDFESMVSSSLTLDTPTSFPKQAYDLLIGSVGYALRDSCSAPRHESHQPFRRRPNYSLRIRECCFKHTASPYERSWESRSSHSSSVYLCMTHDVGTIYFICFRDSKGRKTKTSSETIWQDCDRASLPSTT
jgi:hypothetical protein